MNIIPGASDLGWGFNIFGQYSTKSLKSQLFEFRGDSTVWKDPINGVEYIVPANVSPTPVEDNSAGGQAFSTRMEAQEFFAAEAGLEASYVTEFGAFSGAFN